MRHVKQWVFLNLTPICDLIKVNNLVSPINTQVHVTKLVKVSIPKVY